MKIAIILETIHKEIQQVKAELHILRNMLDNESALTDEDRTILMDFPVAS